MAAPSNKPLVSCVIPAYNLGHLLERALQSVLGQDYGSENIEIIVIDDGSTDNTPDVVAPYLDRIRYVRKENGGLASSFNRGIAEATGEFIATLDADDEWTHDKVSRQIALFDGRPELGVVYSDLEIVDADGNVTEPSYFRMLKLTPPRGRIFGPELERNYACGGTLMIRASLKRHFHPVPEWMVCQDWPTVVALSRVCEIDLVDAPLYRYRQHGDNMNLGRVGAERLELSRRENEVRRWNIMQMGPGDATEQDMLRAFVSLDVHYKTVMDGLGVALNRVVEVTDAERAACGREIEQGAAALSVRDRYDALCHFVKAVALDPTSGEAREWLRVAHASTPAGDNVAAGVRDFAVLAFADELSAAPALLAAYDDAFAADDNATLAIYAPGWDDQRASDEILAAMASAGIDPDACADVLVITDPQGDDGRRLAARVHAVLSDRGKSAPFDVRPTFGAAELPALRALAERSWAELAAA